MTIRPLFDDEESEFFTLVWCEKLLSRKTQEELIPEEPRGLKNARI